MAERIGIKEMLDLYLLTAKVPSILLLSRHFLTGESRFLQKVPHFPTSSCGFVLNGLWDCLPSDTKLIPKFVLRLKNLFPVTLKLVFFLKVKEPGVVNCGHSN
jgi:hypothetical protein